MDLIIIIGIGSIICNLLITALNVKLYTEYFKAASISKRFEKP